MRFIFRLMPLELHSDLTSEEDLKAIGLKRTTGGTFLLFNLG